MAIASVDASGMRATTLELARMEAFIYSEDKMHSAYLWNMIHCDTVEMESWVSLSEESFALMASSVKAMAQSSHRRGLATGVVCLRCCRCFKPCELPPDNHTLCEFALYSVVRDTEVQYTNALSPRVPSRDVCGAEVVEGRAGQLATSSV